MYFNKKLCLLFLLFVSCNAFWAITCNKNQSVVIDIDGNTYKTIKIGNQWWMAENLNVTHYRNGDPIPQITNNFEWVISSAGVYCVYDNNKNYADTYGYLYNWYAIYDNRKIAPEGWHVPTDDDWKELEMYLGMSKSDADKIGYRGTNEGGQLKKNGTAQWKSPNVGATNKSRFSALPGGERDHIAGNYRSIRFFANFWSSTENGHDRAWHRSLDINNATSFRRDCNKHFGCSVRCVKD